jgi:hypothetical protein
MGTLHLEEFHFRADFQTVNFDRISFKSAQTTLFGSVNCLRIFERQSVKQAKKCKKFSRVFSEK